MNEVDEATTGEWLRQLSEVVDSKDRQINEQAAVINKMTQNRVVVGWLHPQSKRFVHADSKALYMKSPASKGYLEHRCYTIPVFIQLEKPDEG